jgi:hypothetical protein
MNNINNKNKLNKSQVDSIKNPVMIINNDNTYHWQLYKKNLSDNTLELADPSTGFTDSNGNHYPFCGGGSELPMRDCSKDNVPTPYLDADGKQRYFITKQNGSDPDNGYHIQMSDNDGNPTSESWICKPEEQDDRNSEL